MEKRVPGGSSIGGGNVEKPGKVFQRLSGEEVRGGEVGSQGQSMAGQMVWRKGTCGVQGKG